MVIFCCHPSTFFFPCLSALCWGDLTPAKLVLLAFQPPASGWVNEEGEGGFWKVKGESTGLSLPCSPLSFHQHVSTCKCDLHDQSSLRRPLFHSFCSQGAQNTIFSPNPFSLGLPLAASLYKPLASLSVPLTCPHSINSFFITASSRVPPGLILFPEETLMDTALKGK